LPGPPAPSCARFVPRSPPPGGAGARPMARRPSTTRRPATAAPPEPATARDGDKENGHRELLVPDGRRVWRYAPMIPHPEPVPVVTVDPRTCLALECS